MIKHDEEPCLELDFHLIQNDAYGEIALIKMIETQGDVIWEYEIYWKHNSTIKKNYDDILI